MLLFLSGEAVGAAEQAAGEPPQFLMPGGRRAHSDFRALRQGVLDLYSGEAGVARNVLTLGFLLLIFVMVRVKIC